MTTVPATPAPTAMVTTARLGPSMPRHRLLLGTVTACGLPISLTWIVESAPYSAVTCGTCIKGGEDFRQGQRRNA